MQQEFRKMLIENRRVFGSIISTLLLSASALGAQRTGLSAYSQKLNGQFSNYIILGAAIALAVFGFSKAVGSYVGGKFLEQMGRKFILQIGIVILVVGSGVLAFSNSFFRFFAGNGIVGFGIGVIFSSSVVALTDVSSSHHRGKTVSLMELSVYFGTSIGSLISGIVADVWGFKYIFVAAMIITFFSVFPGIFVIDTRGKEQIEEANTNIIMDQLNNIIKTWSEDPNSHRTEDLSHLLTEHRDNEHPSFPTIKFSRRVFFKPSFIVTFLTGIVSRLSDTAMVLVFPLLILAYGFSPSDLGILVFVFTISWSIGIAFSGSLSDKIGRKIPMISGLLLEFLGYIIMFVIGLNNWLPALFVGCACSGFGRGIYYPIPPSAITDSIAIHYRAYVMGVYRFILDFGYVIGATMVVVVVELRNESGTVSLLEPVMISVIVFLLLQALLVSILFKDPRPGYPQFSHLEEHFTKVQQSIQHLSAGISNYVSDDKTMARENLRIGKQLERDADLVLEQITKATYAGVWRGSDSYELLQFAIAVDKSVGYTMRGLRKLLLVDEPLSDGLKSKLDLYAQILDVLVMATVDTFQSLDIRFNLATQNSYMANYVEEYLDDIHKSLWEDLLGLADTLKPINLLLLSSVIDTIEKGANTMEDAAELIRLISFKH